MTMSAFLADKQPASQPAVAAPLPLVLSMETHKVVAKSAQQVGWILKYVGKDNCGIDIYGDDENALAVYTQLMHGGWRCENTVVGEYRERYPNGPDGKGQPTEIVGNSTGFRMVVTPGHVHWVDSVGNVYDFDCD